MDDEGDEVASPCWWVIDEESFMAALNRVAAGETPEGVYMECFANACIDLSEDEDDEP